MLGDVSPLTCRSYGFDLLRWHRLLWCLQTSWDKATEAEVAVLVGWLREARNPQRFRKRRGWSPGSVNLKTGKPSLREGYAPSTINHNLTVISGFYAFHARFGAGPVVNPVPASRERRQALAHRSPLEPVPAFRRGRLRQKVPAQAPRAIADHRWDELLSAMGCDRDRALLEFYVSSGARASELLGIGLEDIDWPGQLIYANGSSPCPPNCSPSSRPSSDVTPRTAGRSRCYPDTTRTSGAAAPRCRSCSRRIGTSHEVISDTPS
jgi:integrase